MYPEMEISQDLVTYLHGLYVHTLQWTEIFATDNSPKRVEHVISSDIKYVSFSHHNLLQISKLTFPVSKNVHI